MSVIIQDGFDSEPTPTPTLSNWVKQVYNGGNFATIAGGANGTAQAIRCNCIAGVSLAQWAWIEKTFPAVNAINARVYFRALEFTATLDGTPIDVRANSAAGYALAWAHISPTGVMSLYYNSTVNSNTPVPIGSIQLNPNVWYLIEVHVGCNTASVAPYNGFAELWVNGTLIAAQYNINNSPVGQATLVQFGTRYYNNTSAHSIDIDEVLIETPSATTWRLNISTTGVGTLDQQSQDVSQTQSVTVNVTSGTLQNWIDNGSTKAPSASITIPAQTPGTTYSLVAAFSGGPVPEIPWYLFLAGGITLSAVAIIVVLARGRKKRR